MTQPSRPCRHVVFSASAAGIVAHALRLAGFDDQVVSTADDLSCGPIDDIRGAARRDWIAENLDWTCAELFVAAASSWDAVTAPSICPVAWVTRHDARDLASYLEFTTRIGDAPFDVVDLPRLQVPCAGGRGSFALRHLALLSPEDIVAERLWIYRRPAEADEIARDRETWRRLRAENAPLRVMRDGALASAPITWFDDVVLSCTAPTRQPGTRVVGETMAALYDRGELVGDAFLWGRVRALAREGALDIEGDATDMRRTKVRRI